MTLRGAAAAGAANLESMDSITELFLPDSLPPWSKYVVLAFLALHVVGFSVYAVCLCRECARPKEQYAKVKLQKEY